MKLDDIYSVFGGEDPESALLRLAVECPSFGKNDLLLVLRQLCDELDYMYLFTHTMQNAFYGMQGIMANMAGSTTDFVNLFFAKEQSALRTIFKIMFETSAWDDEILFQPGFLDEITSIRDACRRGAKESAAGLYDMHKLEMYKTFDEMVDRLADKIRLHSGT